ncbi:cysteine hydrolase family protein [Pseudomonas syringae]|uniref:Isochorismatase family protein n=3 Tax=Pseudomonas syringae TaxID=317 RepID=A0A9Q4A4W7_PSESX|nr:isochorismatase family cysteine hydrolase [Pseudomonas syringae]MCF5467700.1 isochorismatase family protein [Pseudomonas syringae]MCF5474570.1 isochorismatase family protein [Pseudomonas syringae]MCF5484088.1 isochorismatase family protein [Pseudomonas syringae]MCF5487863.1 isochorismatase family protein [Pseudomonas syringae]MCF5497274.1 isochorismatase family protein [Pseudomonas syringae]
MISLCARPDPFTFEPSCTAVVIIDMQRDFLEPGGFGAALGNDVAPLQAIVPAVQQLLGLARDQGLAVIHTRESHHPDLSDCPQAKLDHGLPGLRIGDSGPMGRILIRGEPGNQIIDALTPSAGEWIIDKPGKGMFYATDLHSRLAEAGITHLIFAGVTTEVCVQSSMREANDRGYRCLLLEDATDSYFPAFKQATLDMITAQGAIVGRVASLADLAQALHTRSTP